MRTGNIKYTNVFQIFYIGNCVAMQLNVYLTCIFKIIFYHGFPKQCSKDICYLLARLHKN